MMILGTVQHQQIRQKHELSCGSVKSWEDTTGCDCIGLDHAHLVCGFAEWCGKAKQKWVKLSQPQ